MTAVAGFSFSDFCQSCQKVMEHRIESEAKQLFGVCNTCRQKRPLTDLNEVYYPKTDLWVTRFKIGNLPSVVAGRLLKSAKR